jgi:Putative zinc-finger
MDRHESAHWDVAAYALGVLDHGEIERYERHLAECASCAADLEYLLPASRLLADVDPVHIRAAVDTQLMDRLLSAVRIDRHRGRRRQRLTITVGTALAAAAAAVVVLAGATWLDTVPTDEDINAALSPSASPEPTESEEPESLPGDSEPFSATDPDSGVEMAAVLEGTDWGTQLLLEISSVTGPRECRLIVVRADGSGEVVGSWRVPASGYGTVAQPRPLLLQAPTATAPGDIDQLQLQAVEPDGSNITLVTVPV